MRQAIDFLTLNRRTEHVTRNDVFTFQKDRKHHWLQRFCLRILHRLGCQYVQPMDSYTRVTISADDFMERLYKQHGELFQLFGVKGTVLLIGAQDFESMMALPEIQQAIRFSGEYRRSRRTAYTIHGLDVRVIPWMSGMVVLRREDLA